MDILAVIPQTSHRVILDHKGVARSRTRSLDKFPNQLVR